MSAASSSRLLTVNDVVERLSVSRSWVYGAAADGRLPSIRLGCGHGPVRFIEEDLECWINEARDAWIPGDGPRETLHRSAAIRRGA